MKKTLSAFFAVLALAVVVLSGVAATKAAFSNTGDVAGAVFTVGNADIQLLSDLAGGTEPENLVDSKQGPLFLNIHPGWAADYPVKLYNNGSLALDLSSASDYVTADDPGGLREYINVEIFYWGDNNNDGAWEESESSDPSLGKKTILKWKSEGIPLGLIQAGEMKGYLLRFTVDTIPETKQGNQATYRFEFDGTTEGVSQ